MDELYALRDVSPSKWRMLDDGSAAGVALTEWPVDGDGDMLG